MKIHILRISIVAAVMSYPAWGQNVLESNDSATPPALLRWNESVDSLLFDSSDAFAQGSAIEQIAYESAVPAPCYPPPSPLCCEPAAAKHAYPTVKVTGFFQADIGWFGQDEANMVAVGDVQDGADFRRARLQAIGDVAENVAYSIEFDFGFPGRPSFMDVWVEVQELPLLNDLKIGLYRQPIGLDALTSVKGLTFIERSLPFAFVPFRQIGAMSHGVSKNEDMTWAVSGFRFPTDIYGGQVGDNGGYGMATRLTGLLVDQKDSALHLGGAYCVIDPANDAVRYRSQPEFFIAETGGAAFVPGGVPSTVPPFVDTDVIDGTSLSHLLSAELATTVGAFHAQSEVLYATVDRQAAASSVSFSGFSAQAAYFLTGEHRPYDHTSGVLGRVAPNRDYGKCGPGAWEVATRYSYLDLNDNDIQGGRLSDWTLGLNWYLNKYTKFQLNYIQAMLDSPINGDSNASIVAARAQLDF